PVFASQVLTTQPLELQMGIIIVAALLLGIFTAAALGLVAGLVGPSFKTSANLSLGWRITLGASVGLVLAGAGALARQLLPSTSPSWGNLGPAAAFVPFITAILGPLTGFFTQALILLMVLYALNRRPRAVVLWIIAGIVLAGSSGIETISSWLILGIASGVLL